MGSRAELGEENFAQWLPPFGTPHWGNEDWREDGEDLPRWERLEERRGVMPEKSEGQKYGHHVKEPGEQSPEGCPNHHVS